MSVVEAREPAWGKRGNRKYCVTCSTQLQARLVLFDIPQSWRNGKHFGQSPFVSFRLCVDVSSSYRVRKVRETALKSPLGG